MPLVMWISLAVGTVGTFPAETGTVHFQPPSNESAVPEAYRLPAHDFAYELSPKCELFGSGLHVYCLSYPSPVVTDCPENNTVHAEFYCPKGTGRFPAVIILDITAGDQNLSRLMAAYLGQQGVASLFVQMAYYGPRRPPGSGRRLLSPDFAQSMAAVRQTVLDVRRAAAWLASRPQLDSSRLGILGTSLGSFIAALSAEMEPRLGRVVILLGGGDLVNAYYDHPKAALLRWCYEACGGTKESLRKRLAPADPITCAANLKNRRVLMVAARRDEIVPPKAVLALWNAAGRPTLVWYDCTHYGAALYFAPAMEHASKTLTAR